MVFDAAYRRKVPDGPGSPGWPGYVAGAARRSILKKGRTHPIRRSRGRSGDAQHHHLPLPRLCGQRTGRTSRRGEAAYDKMYGDPAQTSLTPACAP